MVYTKTSEESEKKDMKSAEIEICIQRKEFTILFNPYPIIYWHQHELEVSRAFGSNGELTKRFKNGNIEILYPNGNTSTLNYGTWTHINNNQMTSEGTNSKNLKMDSRIETDKKIELR